MAKDHWLLSRSPQPIGRRIIAACGADVLYPVAEAPIEVGKFTDLPASTLNECSKCRKMVAQELLCADEPVYLSRVRRGEPDTCGCPKVVQLDQQAKTGRAK